MRWGGRVSCAGIILAGGLSRRMGGGDKGLLDLGGRPLIAHVIARLDPQVDAVAINANGDPARFDGFGLPVIADADDARDGPLAGVLAGMDWAAAQGHEMIATAAADTPFFPVGLVHGLYLGMVSEGVPLARAETARPGGGFDRHPTFGLWSVALRDDLRAALADGVRKVVAWTDPHGVARVVFDGDDPFFNVNTPEDLAQARRRIA